VGRTLLALVGAVLLLEVLGRLRSRFLHYPAPHTTARFLDSLLRRALQPPAEVIAAAGIHPGMTVLELGPGPGTYTIEAARAALPGGRVIAVDIQAEMVEFLRRKAERFGVANIETHVADAYHLPVADESVDLVYMVTVLAEIPDRQRALAEVRRVLKPGGALAVSEFLPDPDYPLRITVRRWAEAAGFVSEGEQGNWLWYVLTFRKRDA